MIVITLEDVLSDRGMTLTELSRRTGIHVVNLSRIKTGKVCSLRFSTLEAICAVLDCQPKDIVSFVC